MATPPPARAQLWLYRVLPTIACLLVGAASFALSYVALSDEAAKVGAVPSGLSFLVPIVVDGGVVCGSAVIWANAHLAQRRARFPFAFVAALVAVSVIVNVAHAAAHPLAKVIAALPPLVLLGTLELVATQYRNALGFVSLATAPSGEGAVGDEVAAGAPTGHEAAPIASTAPVNTSAAAPSAAPSAGMPADADDADLGVAQPSAPADVRGSAARGGSAERGDLEASDAAAGTSSPGRRAPGRPALGVLDGEGGDVVAVGPTSSPETGPGDEGAAQAPARARTSAARKTTSTRTTRTSPAKASAAKGTGTRSRTAAARAARPGAPALVETVDTAPPTRTTRRRTPRVSAETPLD